MAGETIETRVAVLEAQHTNHERHDDERIGRIDTRLERIDNAVASFADKLDAGLKRLHEMREDSDSKHRHAINNGLASANGAVTQLRQQFDAKLDEKIDAVNARVDKTAASVSRLESAGLGKVIAVMGAVIMLLITALGFFVAMQIRPPAPVAPASQQG